jgi:hypothetical protein
MIDSLKALADRKLYDLVRDFCVRRAASAPRWFVAAKPAMRALRLAADVLPAVLNRKDVPAYLRPMLEAIEETIAKMVIDYRRATEEHVAAPLWCAKCGAPAEDVTDKGCARCAEPVARA